MARRGAPAGRAGWACIAVAAAALLAAGSPVPAAGLPAAVDGEPLPSLAPMLERVTPAVVNIAARARRQVAVSPLFQDPFFRQFFDVPKRWREERSLGSGVVVDAKRGYVLTNHHVIEGASEITVTLRDGRRLTAKLVGRDPDSDVAVLQVPPESLSDLPIAESARLRVGDFVVAIGNPFGLGQTVTSGIVSALGRRGVGIPGYKDFIQTDASINVGNSGGALVNLRGELVGINTAIYAPSGGSVGIGFAIPSSMALSIMTDLIEYGRVRRGMLGVSTDDLRPGTAEALSVPGRRGAVIERVARGSPADRAGIRPGDVVVAFNGRPVASSAELGNSIGLERVGESVGLTVIREGKPLELTAVLAPREDYGTAGRAIHSRLTGALLDNVAAVTRSGEELTFVRVLSIDAGTPAWEVGLRRGDIVTSVNDDPVRTVAELARSLSRVTGRTALGLRRGNASRRVLLE